MRRRSFPLLAAALAAACGSGVDGPAEVIVRDSAGVVIVENPVGAEERAPEWRAVLPPVLEIGVVEGEGPYQFSRVGAAVRLTDGTVVVLDQGSREVRYFGPDGAYRATAGGPGDGPGELGFPEAVFLLEGDTIAIWDRGLGRFAFFDTEGRHAGTRAAPHLLPGSPVGFVGEGVVATRSSTARARPGDPEEVLANRQIFLVTDLDGAEDPDTVAVAGEHRLLRWTRNGMVGFTSVPFTVDASGAAGPGRLVVTPGSRRELRVFDAGRRLDRIVRVGGEPEPLTRSRYEAEVERRIAGSPDEEWERERRRQYAAMPRPATLPAYRRILLDEERGGAWVERFRDDHGGLAPLREPSRWTVFDAEGAVEAILELPAGFSPHQVTPEGVLGVRRDELGVEYVWLLAVEW